MKSKTVSLSEILAHPKMSLSPRDYIKERNVKFRGTNEKGELMYVQLQPPLLENLCMTTGCFDNLGKEIFEDDILYDRTLSNASIQEGSREEGFMWLCKLKYENGCYWVMAYNEEDDTFSDTDYPLYNELENLEVISKEQFKEYKKRSTGKPTR